MTIGLTDLLRRTAPLLIIALPLAACEKAEIETAISSITGTPTDQQLLVARTVLTPEQFASASSQVQANLAASSSVEPVVQQVVVSSEEAGSSVAYVPPPPPPCDPVVFRGVIYDCTMLHILGYVE